MFTQSDHRNHAIVVVMLTFAMTACHNLHVTGYTSGMEGSINIMFNHHPVALANFSQRDDGVAVIVFATDMHPGTHAVHLHTSCYSRETPIPGGRLGNIEVDANRIGKLETIIKGALVDDLIGQTVVVHESKDYHYTHSEMSVGGVVGCGVFDPQSRIIAHDVALAKRASRQRLISP